MSLQPPFTAFGTSQGQVVAVAASSSQPVDGQPQAVYGEGPATTGFTTLVPLGSADAPIATANGFIGDADLGNVAVGSGGGDEIGLRKQRHFAFSFAPPLYLLPPVPAPVTALSLGMDFRSDTAVVWAADGEIWAQWVTRDDRVAAAEPIGPSGYAPQISAVLSDDNRSFILWTDEPPPGTSGVTRVFLAHSSVGVIFHGAQQLASFTEPPNVRLTPGSVSIDRLSAEGLAMVWPTMQDGNYALEAAGVTSHKILTPTPIAIPGEDVRLGAVATGPRNDIVVVVEVAPRTATGFDTTQQQLFATRDGEAKGPGLGFAPLEQLTGAGANTDPSVGVDPDSDRAVAAWQSVSGGIPAVQWAVSEPG